MPHPKNMQVPRRNPETGEIEYDEQGRPEMLRSFENGPVFQPGETAEDILQDIRDELRAIRLKIETKHWLPDTPLVRKIMEELNDDN
jgi:hypothetical protein